MHSLVRRYIKTAIVFLVVGLALGAWMIARRELFGVFPGPYVVSAHSHALFVGFIMMMILGVALWLFPRPDRSDDRYDPSVAGAAYWLLTCGTGARVAGELARASGMTAVSLRVAIMIAGFAQIAGIGTFFYTMWTRIRPVGSQAREARGERF